MRRLVSAHVVSWQETRSNSKGLVAVSREIEQLVNMVMGALEGAKRRVDESSSDAQRHALEQGLKEESSRLQDRVEKLCRCVILCAGRDNDGR